MPPPNVTGRLHLGHAMFVALQDILARFHRMRGRPTLWLPGTDHAGIATQLLVERAITAEGLNRVEMGREKFLDRVWQWKEDNGGAICSQMRRLGASADWSREKFTLDDDMSTAVTEAFVRLHEKGLVYRGSRMVNWSPNLGTAVSDLEVEFVEREGLLYYFKYEVEGGGYLPVATSRPETILGDTAVCVNPSDDRYKDYVGKQCIVPMSGGRTIPILADDYVDVEFGTGALKVTPGHDANDYAIGQRNNLPIINIMDEKGALNENGGAYAGMDRFKCRKQLWSDMEEAGLVLKTEPHVSRVPISQRGGEVVEPLVSTQWFVKMDNMASRGVDAVRNGDIQIVPKRFEKEWYNWLENIQDWCVSRQLWWGHQIPVYYAEGHDGYFCARSEEDAREQASKAGVAPTTPLTRDSDVLDTWFSSGLWPFATVGWPENTPDYKQFYPATCLETGYDILFFWVARMVMMGLEFTDEVPFDTIYMHGLVRDEKNEKMSKTKGNVVDPLDVVDEYGADALRFSLVTGVTPGQDVPLSMERVKVNRNFCNKLWNAARFLEPKMVSSSGGVITQEELSSMPLFERYIVSEAHACAEASAAALEDYSIGDAGTRAYRFFYDEFADWYVEVSKTRSEEDQAASQRALSYSFEVCLKLLHPFVPHVTEYLWQKLFNAAGEDSALMTEAYPSIEGNTLAQDAEAVALFNDWKELVRAMRNIRAEYNIEPAIKTGPTIVCGDDALADVIRRETKALALLAKVDPERVTVVKTKADAVIEDDAVQLVVSDGLEVFLPQQDLAKDVKKELDRLSTQLKKLVKDIGGLEGRLGNPGFADKAPADVVEATRAQLAEKLEQKATLDASIAELEKQ
jgi:valyl-tRNA synthetase